MDLPLKFIQSFGLIKGLVLYTRFKFRLNRKFRLPGLKHPLYLRPGTIDAYTFQEIFISRDYDLDYGAGLPDHPVIIDAGANVGLSSVFFANRFPNARIECFEPEEENFKLLVKNTINYTNIRAHKAALWWKSGFVSVLDQGYGLRGYVTGDAGKDNTVPAVTLDDFMEQQDYPFLFIVKMDIEGAEKEIFDHPSHDWLSRVKYLIIELHDSMKPGTSVSFFKALLPYNFTSSISGENLVICFHQSPVTS
jgi:FkbM family methyltransferase